MVVGYVLIGTGAGAVGAMLHLLHGGGSILAALAIFYAICAMTVVVSALFVALRDERQKRRLDELTLIAPVPALHRRGAPLSRGGQRGR